MLSASSSMPWFRAIRFKPNNGPMRKIVLLLLVICLAQNLEAATSAFKSRLFKKERSSTPMISVGSLIGIGGKLGLSRGKCKMESWLGNRIFPTPRRQ